MSKQLVENMNNDSEWWVKSLMASQTWLLIRLRQVVEATKEEDWERIKELMPIIDGGLKGYEEHQTAYNRGNKRGGTYIGGVAYYE